jgi:hypothetical protein
MPSPEMPHADRDLDTRLRETLEPDAAAVDRIVGSARVSEAPTHRAWRWATAGAAAAAVAWLAVAVIPGVRTTSPPETGIEAPPVLRISNEEGAVTVTTPEGSKLIILPGDPS